MALAPQRLDVLGLALLPRVLGVWPLVWFRRWRLPPVSWGFGCKGVGGAETGRVGGSTAAFRFLGVWSLG